MSRKHAEIERELIEDLVPRTGRSLAEWMAAISAEGLVDKNAIIDWLRPQGLTFAHASWLERIHNNGGQPIYLETPGRPAVPPAAAVPLPPTLRETVALPAEQRAPPVAIPAKPAPSSPPTPLSAPAAGRDLTELIARGKGLKPLAEMLLREISQALPTAKVVASGELVSILNPAELAVLSVGPRELRLGLELGKLPFEGQVVRARIPGTRPEISHMVVVTDARQVGAALLEVVRAADRRSNAST